MDSNGLVDFGVQFDVSIQSLEDPWIFQLRLVLDDKSEILPNLTEAVTSVQDNPAVIVENSSDGR
jgi:hypothetical protein